MFASYMTDTWVASTAVAIVAGVVGFFVVVRGSAFLAHAVPHGAFAGAAGAVLIGADPLIGLAVFSAAGALGISALARRARVDVMTALVLVAMLGLGAFFLSRSNEYSAEVFGLLFGQVLGVSADQVVVTLAIGSACLVIVGALWRPLLLASILPATAPARGVNPELVTVVFALVLAGATTMSVPIVGALLMFALLVGPPAAARMLVRTPGAAAATSVLIAVATVWASIALAYETDWPIGFFVATISAVGFVAARAASTLHRLAGFQSGRSHRAANSHS